ncbi:hypothetical protein L0128_21060, partial [candidate division KSB1 bacterium]|nr:hypothetical protein [candidate division KSB1 bacterium]
MESSYLEGEAVAVTAGYFVEEEKVQPSTIGLSREEIRRFPGGFEDVVRTVSTLPGVAINAAGGRNDLLVRGGGPSENLFTINECTLKTKNDHRCHCERSLRSEAISRCNNKIRT